MKNGFGLVGDLSLLGFRAWSSLQCCDTVDWAPGRALGL